VPEAVVGIDDDDERPVHREDGISLIESYQ